ncbi:hypothetical protein CRM22_004427 [Opisthorchis felineus]|uniref:Uncharacterized protein n=2 Tax=Opisthorchis felineus TaxID=147828 RepID=A0A4S2M1I6_OPIFE|nr:hypothetical protein CRM22_004427 [Opisthorchis felineus]TGZ68120.1 hypothetical protein CRM22_004427 [Opisthorchis felineus]
MEAESLPDFSAFAVRQADPRFRSPGIMRKHLGREAVAAHTVKKSRRAKSTEPSPLDPKDPQTMPEDKDTLQPMEPTDEASKRWSMNAKTQENMSKSELINSYRLLMNEKLRLERFLSIMSKNHEMARNRLESDLLDAMMCIEDLKQALELRMARRRKIDPREAEERRYLIRQNKKLLNQLYESAKKIERLELTKVEMKEQLELLDFQILEVENQKAMMEEELRKLPSCNHSETQTEDNEDSISQRAQHLKEQVIELQSELCSQKAETAAALAKQHHLDNLVRELRRDNVDLRDQLSKLDDAENSLAESDKPLATGIRALQSQLDTQLERVRELESKLKASRDYSEELETRLQTMDLFKRSHDTAGIQPTTDNTQAAMHDTMTASGHAAGLRVPRVDDLLLQETIRTFHALLAERDQELVQLKRHIRANVDKDDSSSLVLPDLCESAIQTDLYLGQAERLSQMVDTLATGGFVLTAEQVSALKGEINRCLAVMTQCKSEGSSKQTQPQIRDVLSFGDLISAVVQMCQLAEDVRLQMTLSRSSEQQILTTDLRITPTDESESKVTSELLPQNKSSLHTQPTALTNECDGRLSSSANLRPSSAPVDSAALKPSAESNTKTPKHYSAQLQELRETSDLEVAKAHLSVSERRRQELERRVLEVTDDLARARAEARAAETSLSAARRTEAALRRRLLVAMDIQGSDADGSSNRHSLGPYAGLDTRDNLELQTALIKSEATNASLTEAAQLDRTRLHDQTMRIGQLEAEHRALMDRLSILQANEASAQRGIVRLQALYEDMLREYSEARFQDLSWRTRDRSRSNFRNGTSNGVEKKTNGLGSHSTFTKLQQQIAALEEENLSLKLAVKEAEEARGTVTSQPVGRCSAPACIEVRGLLKAFQDRFADVMGQLTRTQQCLEAAQANSGQDLDTSVASTPNTGLTLVTTVQKRFNALQDLLDNDAATLSEREMDNVRIKMSDCLDALAHLHRWLQLYIRSTDAEIADLRSTIIDMRIASMGSDQTLITTCANGTEEHPFSCSISLNKKLDMDLLYQREQELQQLRARVRDLEAEVELASPHYR